MSSGGKNFYYFPYYSLTKFSALKTIWANKGGVAPEL